MVVAVVVLVAVVMLVTVVVFSIQWYSHSHSDDD